MLLTDIHGLSKIGILKGIYKASNTASYGAIYTSRQV
jgi:hypothetical protein